MSKKLLTPLRFLTRASDPSSGIEGDTYFNTTDKSIRIFNGESWITIVKSTDPTPFYMHTHTYDGEVHSINVDGIVNVKDMSQQSGPEENLPLIIGFDGGNPNTEPSNESPFNLALDGGNLNG